MYGTLKEPPTMSKIVVHHYQIKSQEVRSRIARTELSDAHCVQTWQSHRHRASTFEAVALCRSFSRSGNGAAALACTDRKASSRA